MTTPQSHASALLSSLDWTRRHVRLALEGLSTRDLRISRVASGWTPLNLVRHLTLDVERFWFSAVMAGDPAAVEFFEREASSGWDAPVDGELDAVLADYAAEVERSNAVIAALGPAAGPRWWPATAREAPPRRLHDVLVHVLVDTATHAGHLDIVREQIDGAQFLVIDEV